ncbi:GNAT family N-acetyltransferase [Streptomyces xanthophaeus]|uniref:GNAT family N-acetyltransferase n=1 Tax=Streptomyces xanthophaeus TaxID=67385 RepID=UPI0039900DB1
MATAALVRQGFQMAGIDRLEIHHDAADPASGAIALRLGFTEIGRTRAPEGPVAPGEVGIDVVWRMTAVHWHTQRG